VRGRHYASASVNSVCQLSETGVEFRYFYVKISCLVHFEPYLNDADTVEQSVEVK